MTKQQLIEALADYPDDTPIFVTFELTNYDLKRVEYDERDEGVVLS